MWIGKPDPEFLAQRRLLMAQIAKKAYEDKKNVDGIQFYVKVKITQENGEDILKCLGFHEDEFD